MPVTKIGLVYYADDPNKRIFRCVKPEIDDSELFGTPTDGNGKPYLREDGTAHSWMTLGVDPARIAVMDIVDHDGERARAAMALMMGET